MRFKLLLAYDGTHYEGWQTQDAPRQPLTVQGELEKAFLRLAGRPVRVTGASRTDSGVHALGQTAHVDLPDKQLDWHHCLNALLPAEIRILEVTPVADSFHAQRDAIAKIYHYRFWQDPRFAPPALHNYIWNCGPLNLAAMQAALPLFPGKQDFATFRNAGSNVKTTIRTILSIDLAEATKNPWLPDHLPELRLQIRGTGFLKQMVRNIAGCLVAIGRARLEVSALPEILAARDRRKLPSATAPAKGLCLVKVEY